MGGEQASQARLQPHLQTAGALQTVKKLDGAGPGSGGGTALEITVPGSPHLSGTFKPADMSTQWADTYYGPTRGIAADDTFKLYDTFGFPADLTLLMAQERGLKVDIEGFDKLMEQARERARAGGKFAAETAELALPADAIARLRLMGIAPTADVDKFHGRDIRATVKAIWNGANFDDHADTSVAGVRPVAVILDKTNFYAPTPPTPGRTSRYHQHPTELPRQR